jgi:hypothetical protein
MAGELNLGFSLSLSKSGVSVQRSYACQADVADRAVQQGTVLVTPAGVNLALGSVSTIGEVVVQHVSDGSDADFVFLGQSGGPWPHKMLAGEFVPGRWNLSEIHVKTGTGSAWVDYVVVSE